MSGSFHSGFVAFCLAWVLAWIGLDEARGADAPPWIATNTLAHRWAFKQPLDSHPLREAFQLASWNPSPGLTVELAASTPEGREAIRLRADVNPSDLVAEFRISNPPAWECNRLSFKVFVELPTSQPLTFSLNWAGVEDGGVETPGPSAAWFTVAPGTWTQLFWEFPGLPPGKAARISLTTPTAMNHALRESPLVVLLEALALERVLPDHGQGWAVVAGRVAFPHVGFAVQSRKTAIASSLPGDDFKIIQVVPLGEMELAPRFAHDAPHPSHRERSELSLPIRATTSPLGAFQILDLTELTEAGEYSFRSEKFQSRPFPVHRRPWAPLAEPLAAFFSGRRDQGAGPGSGGWFDDAWLSKTPQAASEGVQSLALLAARLRPSDPGLAAALEEEALWGVRWLLSAREPGTRKPQAAPPLIAHMSGAARPHSTAADFLAASAAGSAAELLMKANPALPSGLLAAARDDFAAGMASMGSAAPPAAAAIRASVGLFLTTGEQEFIDQAAALASWFCESQDSPLLADSPAGLSEEGDRACESLSILVEVLPRHSQAIKWYGAVVGYSEVLLSAARATAPFEVALGGGARAGAGPRAANPILLSRGRAAAAAARLRRSPSLAELAERHLQWLVGRNPFNQSFVAGVGYDCPSQFSPMRGELFGAVLGGPSIDARGAIRLQAATIPLEDGAELVSAASLAFLLAEVLPDTLLKVVVEPGSRTPVLLTETKSQLRFEIQPAAATGSVSSSLPQGSYLAAFGPREQAIDLVGPRPREINMARFLRLEPRVETLRDGRIRIRFRMEGEGEHLLRFRPGNFEPTNGELAVSFKSGFQQQATIEGVILDKSKPAFLLVVPNRDADQRLEVLLPVPH